MDITKMLARENTVKKVQQKDENKQQVNGDEKVDEKKNFESLLTKTKEASRDGTENSSVSNEVEESDIKLLVEALTPENKEILNTIINLLENTEEFSIGEGEEGNLQNANGEKDDLIEILALLLSLMQGKQENKNVEPLEKSEGFNVLDALTKSKSFNELVKEVKSSENTSENNLNDILVKLINELKETPKEEVDGKLLNLLRELTRPENKNIKSLVKEVKSELREMVNGQLAKNEEVSIPKIEGKENSLKGDEENLQSSKEEKFLKSLTGEEDKNTKPLLINNFKTSFGRVEQVKEAPIVSKNNVVFDMVKTIKYMNPNSLKELTIKIYPKELGEITISISQDKDVMKANIKANTKDAYHLLSNNLNEIKKSLGEQNIKIQEVNIGLYSDDTTFYREGQEEQSSLYKEVLKNGKSGNRETLGEEIEEIKREEVYKGNVNMLA